MFTSAAQHKSRGVTNKWALVGFPNPLARDIQIHDNWGNWLYLIEKHWMVDQSRGGHF